MIKIIEVEDSRLAKLIGYNIILYPFIFYHGKPSLILRKHEMIHVEQIRSIGFIRFYLSYILFYLAFLLSGKSSKDAYLAIPYEVEAYKKEKE